MEVFLVENRKICTKQPGPFPFILRMLLISGLRGAKSVMV